MLVEENINQTWSETDSFTIDRYKQFSKYFRESSTVLDMGCNTGRGGVVIKSIFPDVELHGIDLVKERLLKIPVGIYKTTQAAPIEESSFDPNSFDFIVAGEIIEHIPKEVLSKVLKTCYTILRTKGQLILTTPNPGSFLVKLGRTAVFKDPSHVNILSVQQLKAVVLQHNFKIKAIKGSGKAIRYLGQSFPLIDMYGSYLMLLEK
jgi:2-polyprenyl-3-methyl-5-hydroxy-6-metoxy-1,4-benzoquinol methylase